MDQARLRELLEEIQGGALGVDEGLRRLGTLPFEDLGHTLLDTHRALRCGHPDGDPCSADLDCRSNSCDDAQRDLRDPGRTRRRVLRGRRLQQRLLRPEPVPVAL